MSFVSMIVAFILAVASAAQRPGLDVVLHQQTQQMLDAIAAGDRAPWIRFVHDAVVYTAEDGAVKTKAQLVDEIRPLPKNISGRLHLTKFRVSRFGTTAVASYTIEEDESYFGQVLHARYMNTDTWIQTSAGWKLVAAQVLALRADPPELELPESELDEYVGVYRLTDDVTYTIRREEGGLVGVRTGRTAERLKVEVKDCLFVPGQPRLRKLFRRDDSGRVDGFVERRESWDIVWRRIRQVT